MKRLFLTLLATVAATALSPTAALATTPPEPPANESEPPAPEPKLTITSNKIKVVGGRALVPVRCQRAACAGHVNVAGIKRFRLAAGEKRVLRVRVASGWMDRLRRKGTDTTLAWVQLDGDPEGTLRKVRLTLVR